MDLSKVKIGFAPTRRNLFSADAAVEYANLTRDKMNELGVNYIDILTVNEEGLLYDDEGVNKVAEMFREEKVDGLFIANENFGNEWAVSRLAKKLGVPVLLWGPKDEPPAKDGSRLRDTQCGLFAIGKVLRRFNIPFTYIKNSDIESPEFSRGLKDFIRVCSVVKTFKNTRILQVGPRPFDFWSVIANEGELLEKFNISLSPVPLQELYQEMDRVSIKEVSKVKVIQDYFNTNTVVEISQEDLKTISVLALALKNLADSYGCNAGTIQCWTALQDEIGILPYASISYLQEIGLPFSVETDIHGVITQLLAEAATLNKSKAMLVDVNCRHPEEENGELMQHLGVCALDSNSKEKPILPQSHFVFDYPGSVGFEAKEGKYTVCRFDGDHGEYKLLMGTAETMDGPYNQGTFTYFEFDNLNRFESKLVYGPYIHHVSAIREDIVPILYEATKYLGIEPDFYDPIEEDIKAYWRGDKL